MSRVGWHGDGMLITTRHREVEKGFRRLVSDAQLTEPDRVEYEPAAVLFFWEAQKLCVAVDFDATDVGLDGDEHPSGV